MIVIEGPDNAGKTTLANELATMTHRGVVHSPNHKDMMSDYDKWYLWILKSLTSPANRHILYDRHPLISEQVYGPMLRNKNVFNDGPGRLLFEAFIGSSPFVIYCRPPKEAILDFGEREQMEGVKEKAEAMIRGYDKFMYELFRHPRFNGDILDYDRTPAISTVVDYIRRYEDGLAAKQKG